VNPVDNTTIGIYNVTYDVNDSSNNAAIQVTRPVNVVDTTAPVITLLGSDPVTIEVNTVYTDAGATALDNYEGDLTGSIVTVNPVDNTTIGIYNVTYDVNDSSNNAAIQVTRTVNVIAADSTAPTIVYVNLNTTTPNPGDDVLVMVNTVDDTAVTNVVANGVSLSNVGGNIWWGTIVVIEGTHSVNVSSSDAVPNTAWDNTTTYTAPDITAPTIVYVNLNTTTPYVGEGILVTVNVTDTIGVISVDANGILLADQGNDIWSGTITAILGTHTVNVSATDGTNIVWDNSTSYSTSVLTGTISGRVTQ